MRSFHPLLALSQAYAGIPFDAAISGSFDPS